MIIESTQNDKIKYLTRLITDNRFRKKSGVFVVEGKQENERAAQFGFELVESFICESIFNEDFPKGKFNLVSFDNLALEQLNIKDKVSSEEWDERFMGEEGQFSMYYDSVKNKVFKSSLETEGYYAGKNDIEILFELIKK